jgi:hypothetical protein
MPQFLNRLAVEHTAAVLSDEDQMDVHCKDGGCRVKGMRPKGGPGDRGCALSRRGVRRKMPVRGSLRG